MLRAIGFLLFMTAVASGTHAEEWVSHTGECYDWEGRWTVHEQENGLWVGSVDLVNNGRCGHPPHDTARYAVRATFAGDLFFGYRSAGNAVCHMHGEVRGDRVNGYELCLGHNRHTPFEMRLSPPPRYEDRGSRRDDHFR